MRTIDFENLVTFFQRRLNWILLEPANLTGDFRLETYVSGFFSAADGKEEQTSMLHKPRILSPAPLLHFKVI